jgi:hypothetical protein
VRGSSTSVRKKYRQIQNQFWNLQKKYSVLSKWMFVTFKHPKQKKRLEL